MDLKKRTLKIIRALKRYYPDVKCALKFKSAFELLISTILSAQCTDAQVNKTTPALFARFKTPPDFVRAPQRTIESMIRSTGFYKNKAASIKKCCAMLIEKYESKVPNNMEDLVLLPGVGRKTANAVLGNYFGLPAIVVDTHVIRVSSRLKLTRNTDPEKIEFDLRQIVPKKDWTIFSLLIQAHGRKICVARKPVCPICPIGSFCPSKGLLTQGLLTRGKV